MCFLVLLKLVDIFESSLFDKLRFIIRQPDINVVSESTSIDYGEVNYNTFSLAYENEENEENEKTEMYRFFG